MNTRQALTYNLTGQEVYFYPPEWSEGVPTGTTQYRVFRALQSNDDTPEIALANATSDPVSTNLGGAAGYGQTNRRSFSVGSATGLTVGERYVLTNSSLQRELIQVAAVNGTAITTQTDLAYDYASGNALNGLRQYFTINATFIATESKISYVGQKSDIGQPDLLNNSATGGGYRVEWLYTLNSKTRRAWTNFDVVRAPKIHGVTVQDLMELWPGIKGEEPLEQIGQGWAPQIDAAFERVTFDAQMHGVNVAQLRDGQVLDELVRQCSFWLIAEALSLKADGMRDVAAMKKAQYREDFQQAIGVLKTAVDQGTEGRVNPDPIRQIAFRR